MFLGILGGAALAVGLSATVMNESDIDTFNEENGYWCEQVVENKPEPQFIWEYGCPYEDVSYMAKD